MRNIIKITAGNKFSITTIKCIKQTETLNFVDVRDSIQWSQGVSISSISDSHLENALNIVKTYSNGSSYHGYTHKQWTVILKQEAAYRKDIKLIKKKLRNYYPNDNKVTINI